MAKTLDPELTEAEFVQGDSDDADQKSDVEALGGRHRRRFGYTSEGAQENDRDIADKGRKPQKISMHASPVPESRIANFQHGNMTRTLTTVKTRKRVSTI